MLKNKFNDQKNNTIEQNTGSIRNKIAGIDIAFHFMEV